MCLGSKAVQYGPGGDADHGRVLVGPERPMFLKIGFALASLLIHISEHPRVFQQSFGGAEV